MGKDKQRMQDKKSHILSATDCTCRILVEAMGEGALVLSCEGTIIYCNQTFAKMLERSINQVQGCAIYNFIADSDNERLRQLLGQSCLSTKTEISLLGCDAQKIPALLTVFSIETPEEGGQLSVYVVVKDLSDLRKAEVALEARTNQLEASNKELESFFSSASHELHTPLRHIQSFTELLSDHLLGALDHQSSHYLDVISHAATEMNLLIDKLLDWARIGSASVNLNRVDMNLLVSSVVDSFACEKADRIIEWDIGHLPDVCGDLNMLRTAFVCLVSNAVKFTRLQPVAKIRIAAEPSLTNKNDIVVSIKDNGVGFDMQHEGKMFGMFQKIHNHKEFEGNGIGLATVKRIVQRHGGKVWADSEQGKGTAIYLTLGKYGQES